MAEARPRKLWLDWHRGLAVLFMVEWHTYDAWRADWVAQGFRHEVMRTIGGFAAPAFLYMAGLSQVLADAALARKGVPARERRIHALRRAVWLLGVAYGFRLAEYVLGMAFRVEGGWQVIFRVDVLNIIAASLLLSALLATGLPARAHGAVAAASAAAFALLAPLVAGWKHADCHVLDYLYGEYPRAIFYLFPWAVFVFAGSGVGRWALSGARPRVWLGAGAALFAGGWLAHQLPPVYEHQDFWHTAPAWVSMRLGIAVATSGLLQLLPERADRALSWLRTLGRHSLLGYFISIEIPYGLLSRPLHRKLGFVPVLGAIVAVAALTWAAAVLADRWDARKAARTRAARTEEPRAA